MTRIIAHYGFNYLNTTIIIIIIIIIAIIITTTIIIIIKGLAPTLAVANACLP